MGIIPKHIPNLSGAALAPAWTIATALSSPQFMHPCVSQSRLPAAASQSFSKHFPKAAVICSLACWERSHLQHGLIPAFSTLDGHHVVTCA